MPYQVIILRQAEGEVNSIVDWLAERSPQGAARWLAALENAKAKLVENPLSLGLAPENDYVDAEIRQILFKTRRGRRYRALFIVVMNEVRILHVRAPGQSLLKDSELSTD